MNRTVTLIVGALLFVLVATATEEGSKYEVFLGYTTLRTDVQNNNPLLNEHVGNFFMQGGSGQFIYNFNKWFSGVADLGAVHANADILNLKNGVDDRTTSFLFGPRFSHRTKRWTPYVQVLFGGAERSATKSVSAVTGENTPEPPVVTPYGLFPGPGVEVTAQLSASQTEFAMTAGGGLDIQVSKRFTIRPFAADYMLTRFNNLVTGNRADQHSLRLSGGITFTFGEGR